MDTRDFYHAMREQHGDDVLLHGTPHDFEHFVPRAPTQTAHGIFFTREPSVADYYRGGDKYKPGRVLAVRLAAERMADFRDPKVLRKVYRASGLGQGRWGTPFSDIEEAHGAGELYNASMGHWQNSLVDAAHGLGYHGVKFLDTTHGLTDLSHVVFDPAHVQVIAEHRGPEAPFTQLHDSTGTFQKAAEKRAEVQAGPTGEEPEVKAARVLLAALSGQIIKTKRELGNVRQAHLEMRDRHLQAAAAAAPEVARSGFRGSAVEDEYLTQLEEARLNEALSGRA
jgi:hypothetical protein